MQLRTPIVVGAGVLLACLCAGPALGQVSGLVIQYQAFFTQTSTSPPGSSTTHQGSAFLTFGSGWNGTVDSLDVIKPSGAIVPTSGSGTFYSTGFFTYPSRTALMAAWPSGTYTFRWIDDDLITTDYPLPQPSAAGVWPAAVPAFTPASYAGLQGMNPALPRTVDVNTFTVTPPANGQLSGLAINQRFGNLPGPTAWSSLTTIGAPTATRTIPANALQPNTDYFATWTFDQRISNSFPPPAAVRFTNISFGHLTRVAFRTGAAVVCIADTDDGTGTGTPDGGVTIEDLLFFLAAFELGDAAADVDNGSGTGLPDGGVTIEDLLYYLVRFEAGC